MDCPTLQGMIESLSIQLGLKNTEISNKQGQIDDQIPVIIASDIWSGSPPTNWTLANVNTRVNELFGVYMSVPAEMRPYVQATINEYMVIKDLLEDKATLVAEAATMQATLNDLLAQKQAQGCP